MSAHLLSSIDVNCKQWAIGDWLVDGMNHFEEEHGEKKKYGGTGLYEEAQRILELDQNYLRQAKSLAEQFTLLDRSNNLSWRHHYEVASLKTIEEANGKLMLSMMTPLVTLREKVLVMSESTLLTFLTSTGEGGFGDTLGDSSRKRINHRHVTP